MFGEEEEASSEEEDESMEIYGEADIDNSLESVESMEDDLMESSLNSSTNSTNTTSSSSILATDCPGGCNFLFVNSDLTDEVIVIAILHHHHHHHHDHHNHPLIDKVIGAVILVFTIVVFIASFIIMVRR